MSRAALAEALRAHGGTVATLVTEADDGRADGHADDRAGGRPDGGMDSPPRFAARGPRIAAAQAAEYELLLEMILEGSLLHYGTPRVLRVKDRDLALLLGDQLYALGLSRLADLGDLEAVAELADLISLLAQARAAGDAELAEALWVAGGAAVGWGPTREHEAAKALARAGAGDAAAALRASAHRDALDPQ